MNKDKAIQLLERLQDPEPYEPMLTKDAYDAIQMAIDALSADGDTISRAKAIEALDKRFDSIPMEQTSEILMLRKDLRNLPPARQERTCVNCGRTVNNGGWYADGGTRCPIEEHYALPKDGYCHLWEKRNVTDDDYPERREE